MQKTAIITDTNGGITHSIVVKLISHAPRTQRVWYFAAAAGSQKARCSLWSALYYSSSGSICVRTFVAAQNGKWRGGGKNKPQILHARAKWRQSVRITHTHTRLAKKKGLEREMAKCEGVGKHKALWAHLFYSTHLALGGVCSLLIYIYMYVMCVPNLSEWVSPGVP